MGIGWRATERGSADDDCAHSNRRIGYVERRPVMPGPVEIKPVDNSTPKYAIE